MLTEEEKNKIKECIDQFEIEAEELTTYNRDRETGLADWDDDEEYLRKCQHFLKECYEWCYDLGLVEREDGKPDVDLDEVACFVESLEPYNCWTTPDDLADIKYDEWSGK